jgi:hypothetical protein
MWRRARQHSRLTGLVDYHLRDPRRRDRRGICNLAARLCAEAKDGQILISSRIAGAVEAIGSGQINTPDLSAERGARRNNLDRHWWFSCW